MATIEQRDNSGQWRQWHLESIAMVAIDIAKLYAVMFPFLEYRVLDTHGRIVWESPNAPIGI